MAGKAAFLKSQRDWALTQGLAADGRGYLEWETANPLQTSDQARFKLHNGAAPY